MTLTASEEQQLKSGLYNANSVIQRLRLQIGKLERTVSQQGVALSELRRGVEVLLQRFEDLEENAVVKG